MGHHLATPHRDPNRMMQLTRPKLQAALRAVERARPGGNRQSDQLQPQDGALHPTLMDLGVPGRDGDHELGLSRREKAEEPLLRVAQRASLSVEGPLLQVDQVTIRDHLQEQLLAVPKWAVWAPHSDALSRPATEQESKGIQ